MSAHRRRLEIAPRAQRDIRDIRLFSRILWNQARADTYDAAIRRSLETIRDNPEIGVIRDDVDGGIRAHRVNRHHIYYRATDDVKEIIRILHEWQDAGSVLRAEPHP